MRFLFTDPDAQVLIFCDLLRNICVGLLMMSSEIKS